MTYRRLAVMTLLSFALVTSAGVTADDAHALAAGGEQANFRWCPDPGNPTLCYRCAWVSPSKLVCTNLTTKAKFECTKQPDGTLDCECSEDQRYGPDPPCRPEDEGRLQFWVDYRLLNPRPNGEDDFLQGPSPLGFTGTETEPGDGVLIAEGDPGWPHWEGSCVYYMRLEVNRRATTRTVTVDFGDGYTGSYPVPAGSGAYTLHVDHMYTGSNANYWVRAEVTDTGHGDNGAAFHEAAPAFTASHELASL